MTTKQKYLELSGYRLPTEAEWEFACRANTITKRYYGAGDILLPAYARYLENGENHAWPVGARKPNDFGLFDMHGNVWNWCDGLFDDYPKSSDTTSEDLGTSRPITDDDNRMLRGGAFTNQPRYIRSAERSDDQPEFRQFAIGFRPARTYP